MLTKLPGIGKKTAERMLLELKDKIGPITDDGVTDLDVNVASGDIVEEGIQALIALGYNQNEIMPIVKRIGKNVESVESLIKLALREFSRG